MPALLSARRVRRVAALVAASLAATVAVAALPGRADRPANPVWRTPRAYTSGSPSGIWTKPSNVMDPAVAPSVLSYDAKYFLYLNSQYATIGGMPIGTGKLYRNTQGTPPIVAMVATYGSGLLTNPSGNAMVVKSAVAKSGSLAYSAVTYVDPFLPTDNPNMDVARQIGDSYAYPAENSALNDWVFCISEEGRYVSWVGGADRTQRVDDGDGDPNNDKQEGIGGTLYRMDVGAGNPPPTGVKYSTRVNPASTNVISVACDGKAEKYLYTRPSGTAATYTQQLYLATRLLSGGTTTEIPQALPAPFDATPSALGLAIAAIDMSPNGEWALFAIEDTTGQVDFGQRHYYIRRYSGTTVVSTTELAAGFKGNSIGDNGTVGVTQEVAWPVAMTPKLVKADGSIVNVGPAEERLQQYALVSGDGLHAVYATAATTSTGTIDTNGVDDYVSVTIEAGTGGGTLPTANAGPSPRETTEGRTVTLSGAGSSSNDPGQPVDNYYWYLGATPKPSPDHVGTTWDYTAPDGPSSQQVTLVVEDSDGQSAPVTVTVNSSNAAPTVSFADVSPRTGTVGTTEFLYVAAATDPPDAANLTYEWDFDGDGTRDTTTTSNTESHVFPSPGAFTGSVTVDDGDGGRTSRALPSVTVSSQPTGNLPTANAGLDQTVAESLSSTVTVDASGSSTNDTGQSFARVDFDVDADGQVEQSGTSLTFQFAPGSGPATRLVRVSVTDPDGTAQDTMSVTVQNVAPTITMAGVNPSSGTAGTTPFTFAASAADPADAASLSYSWDFDGDGSADATGASPAAHTFPAPGSYAARLAVSDGDGGTASTVLSAVDVAGRLPHADAGADTTVDEGGAAATLDGSASSALDPGQAILEYAWDLGENGSVDGSAATFDVAPGDGPRTQRVSLRVRDTDGWSAADSVTVTTRNVAPTVTSATVDPASGVAGETQFTFAASATDPADASLTYRWDFDGNGSVDATGAAPAAHVFPYSGTFTPKLTVDDGDGDTATSTLPAVQVAPGTGSGDPNADDDRDGIPNGMDGDPQSRTLLALNKLCGSGRFPGVRSTQGSVGGCVSTVEFFGMKLLVGDVYLYDGSMGFSGSWLFTGRKVRTAQNVAFYEGQSIVGFDFLTGFKIASYKIAVFDNGAAGDRVVAKVTGVGAAYTLDTTLSSGNITVG